MSVPTLQIDSADALEVVLLLTDYLTGQSVPDSPREGVRQEAARYLVESLGYPKDVVSADAILAGVGGEPYVADLVVTRPGQGPPLIVVEAFEPGSKPDDIVPAGVISSGAQFYFWFDGFGDTPEGRPSWGTRYFERSGDGFDRVTKLPHHHRKLKARKRRPNSKTFCPSCDENLEQFCLVPCTDDCPGWSCPFFGLLRCPTCNKSIPRSKPRPESTKRAV